MTTASVKDLIERVERDGHTYYRSKLHPEVRVESGEVVVLEPGDELVPEEPQDYVTKDSGQREDFETGSRRDSRKGKGRYDLLPAKALRRVALLMERGAVKYGEGNWQRGQPYGRCMDSLLRHAFQALEGKTDEDHLAAVVFNALAIMQFQEEGREDLNDLWKAAE